MNIHEILTKEDSTLLEISLEKEEIDNIGIEVFPQILRKLRYGGKIKIVGVDLHQLCLGVLKQNITYGKFREITKYKVSLVSLKEMRDILKHNGFNVLIANLDNIYYFVSAERKKP
jgi:hypothetical protein